MYESSSIELSLKALRNNIRFLHRLMGKDVKISSVVKGNAYGHGIAPFVKIASKCGINHFSVFSADEALEIKNTLHDNATIMIMGLVEQESLQWAIANDIEFFVFEKKRLQEAIKVSRKISKPAKIHIELETGMNRTGFSAKELPAIIKFLKTKKQNIHLKGLCTHYAGAENIANYQRVKNQVEAFQQLKQMFIKENIEPEQLHTACSAASIMFPETRMDMVRIGIMQYGLWSSPETFMHYLNSQRNKKDPLKRVIAWKSHVMSVKQVSAGDFIGYGSVFTAHEKMKVAVIPVGYAQGFSRSLGNHGRVLIHEKLCPVVGTVNMNMMVVDVSEIPQVQKGDEAVMIGNQNGQQVTVASFSEFSNQLNYELLTRLPPNIPRKIIS